MGPPGESLIGLVLGEKYRLDALIGQGGFGAVYRGWHLLLDVPVAVKIAFRVDGGLGRRFRREARTLMRLRHPSIVRIYDYGRDPQGHVYMVQEFVAGQPLDALLREHGRLPASAAVHIAVQALDALQAAHDAGIVHRDIKPGNLMVQGGLDAPRVQLLDFGIAKIHDDEGEQTELTRPGGAPGTPAYMAPEQINGEAEPASDLYALGGTLFRVLTGERPFPYSGHRIYMAHMIEPVPQLPADVPPVLAAVVRRAMAKKPADRFDDARAMAAALAPLFEGTPTGVLATSPTPSVTPTPPSAVSGPPVAAEADTVTSSPAPTTVDVTGLPGPEDDASSADTHGWALAGAAPPTLGVGSTSAESLGAVEAVPPTLDVESTSAESRGFVGVVEAAQAPARSRRSIGWVAMLLLGGVAIAAAGVGLWGGESSPKPDASTATAAIEAQDSARPAPPVPDTAPPDADLPDADLPDAAQPDAAQPDAGQPDAGQPDAGQPDATPPAPVARPRPKPRRPKASPARRLEKAIGRALAACRCDDAKTALDDLEAIDPTRWASLRREYSKRCVMVGLPGGCR